MPALCLSLFVLLFSSCGNTTGNKPSQQQEMQTPAEALTPGASVPEKEAELQQAALDGELDLVQSLVKEGTDVNAMDADGRTALMYAAFNGHAHVVLHLLDQGAVLDRRDLLGRTALFFASTGPFPETVSILIDQGAQVDVVDSNEHFSPLMHAAAEGNLDVVKLLIAAGANTRLKDIDGDDAAFFARQAGHVAVAQYLESVPR